MFTKSISALVAVAVLSTASLSATSNANAGKHDALIAGAVIGITGAIIGAAAVKNGYAVEYKSEKRRDRHERKSWKKKYRQHCELVPVYENTWKGYQIVGYDKVCN